MTGPQLGAVRRATHKLTARRRAVDVAEREWRDVIREAIDAGHSVSAIAAAAGITRARVYQIRDDRR